MHMQIFLFHRCRDDDGCPEVVLASQGLSEVTATIQGLSDLVKETRTTLVLTVEQSRNAMGAFICLDMTQHWQT